MQAPQPRRRDGGLGHWPDPPSQVSVRFLIIKFAPSQNGTASSINVSFQVGVNTKALASGGSLALATAEGTASCRPLNPAGVTSGSGR